MLFIAHKRVSVLAIGRVECPEHPCRRGATKEFRSEIQPEFPQGNIPIIVAPSATAGLKTPPDTLPTAKAPASTVP